MSIIEFQHAHKCLLFEEAGRASYIFKLHERQYFSQKINLYKRRIFVQFFKRLLKPCLSCVESCQQFSFHLEQSQFRTTKVWITDKRRAQLWIQTACEANFGNCSEVTLTALRIMKLLEFKALPLKMSYNYKLVFN